MHWSCVVLLLFHLAASASFAADGAYRHRWVYVSRGLHQDEDVAEIRDIVRTAAAHGMNGMVLSAGLARLDLQPPHYFRRLEAVKAICAEHKIEIIPIVLSAGYGGSVLAHDRNLAAGLPVRDAPFVVRRKEARLAADPVEIPGADFEHFDGHRVRGVRHQDQPGQVSFVDTKVFRRGAASLRMENFGGDRHGHGRVMYDVAVRPYRCYRVTWWVKTDNLQPPGCFRVQVLAGERYLAPRDPGVPATTDWRKVTLGFNSLHYDRVKLYAGVWRGQSGRFWVDDLRIEEAGLVNVLRRPGTPVTVRDAETGVAYEEGRDFASIADPKLDFRFDHDGPTIKLSAESRIRDGRPLHVSYYHGIAINRGQVSVCMSSPELYKIWAAQVKLIHRHLQPKRYLLSMDEIRTGGSCEACRKRKMSMAEILGDCITRQVEMIRQVNPHADVLVWSDMLDPNHNARDNYYLVEGDYTGSWNHVPKNLIIVCWYFKKRNESLGHFSRLGFRTLAGAYYDGDTLDNPKGWLESLDGTPGAIGIMYTTWRNKYTLLPAFGDLVSRHRGSPPPHGRP